MISLATIAAFLTGGFGFVAPTVTGFLGVAGAFLGGWKIKAALLIVAVVGVGGYVLVNKWHMAELRADVAKAERATALEAAEHAKCSGELKLVNERVKTVAFDLDQALGAAQANRAETARVRAEGRANADNLAAEIGRVRKETLAAAKAKEKVHVEAKCAPPASAGAGVPGPVGAWLDFLQQRP